MSGFGAHHLSASGRLRDLAGLEAVDAPARLFDQVGAVPGASCFAVGFFVRPGDRFFVPTCPGPVTPRADAVKDGRRGAGVTSSTLARPRLDGGEHGVTLAGVGTA